MLFGYVFDEVDLFKVDYWWCICGDFDLFELGGWLLIDWELCVIGCGYGLYVGGFYFGVDFVIDLGIFVYVVVFGVVSVIDEVDGLVLLMIVCCEFDVVYVFWFGDEGCFVFGD